MTSSSTGAGAIPFYVAFAINVVALFARLRLVSTNEYARLLDERELQPVSVFEMGRGQGRNVLIAPWRAGQLRPVPPGHRVPAVLDFRLPDAFRFGLPASADAGRRAGCRRRGDFRLAGR